MKKLTKILSAFVVSATLVACGGGGSDEPQLVTVQRIAIETSDTGASLIDLESASLLPDYNYIENTYDEKGRLDIQYLSEDGKQEDIANYETCTYAYFEDGSVTRTYELNVDEGQLNKWIWTLNKHGDTVKLQSYVDDVLSQTSTNVFEYDEKDRKVVKYFDNSNSGVIVRNTYYTYEDLKVFRFFDSLLSGRKVYTISTYNEEGDLIQYDLADEFWNATTTKQYEYIYTYDDNNNLIAKSVKRAGSPGNGETKTYEWQEYQIYE